MRFAHTTRQTTHWRPPLRCLSGWQPASLSRSRNCNRNQRHHLPRRAPWSSYCHPQDHRPLPFPQHDHPHPSPPPIHPTHPPPKTSLRWNPCSQRSHRDHPRRSIGSQRCVRPRLPFKADSRGSRRRSCLHHIRCRRDRPSHSWYHV
jgi:hypothetical protein